MINRRTFLARIRNLIVAGAGAGIFGFQLPAVWAATKIAPTKAEPGHPFTIIDTPEGRLVDGSKAVFKAGGTEVVVDLRTHKPYKTAKGTVPDGLSGACTVFCRLPDGSEFEVGPFTSGGGVVPTIEPVQGAAGTSFTVTDPQGRIEPQSVAIFFVNGQDPAVQGANADAIDIPSSNTLTGKVPAGALEGENLVWVATTPTDPSYFDPLVFNII